MKGQSTQSWTKAATPLSHNRFKVPVLEAVITRTIVAAATMRTP